MRVIVSVFPAIVRLLPADPRLVMASARGSSSRPTLTPTATQDGERPSDDTGLESVRFAPTELLPPSRASSGNREGHPVMALGAFLSMSRSVAFLRVITKERQVDLRDTPFSVATR
jgi:hypothetical protein